MMTMTTTTTTISEEEWLWMMMTMTTTTMTSTMATTMTTTTMTTTMTQTIGGGISDHDDDSDDDDDDGDDDDDHTHRRHRRRHRLGRQKMEVWTTYFLSFPCLRVVFSLILIWEKRTAAKLPFSSDRRSLASKGREISLVRGGGGVWRPVVAAIFIIITVIVNLRPGCHWEFNSAIRDCTVGQNYVNL